MRTFKSGAIRDTEEGKYNYEKALSPLVIERFGQYMYKCGKMADGTFRPEDNWQKEFPLNSFIESGWRHFLDWWKEHRGHKSKDGIEIALCALIFNSMGYLHEILKKKEK